MINTKSIKDKYDVLMANNNAQTISYGISDSYVPNWDEKQALTEYVANFYDENQTDFTITEVEGGIVLEDQSDRGILPNDLAVGNSRSREKSYKIGTHGEGFKLGALVLVRNGKRVIIETIGYTIIFFLESDTKLKTNILKSKIIENDRAKGSKIFLETDSLEEVKERFLFLNNHLKLLHPLLYANNETLSKNHIYVNTLASQTITSYFSYSLHKKQIVNRDRNMLESPYQDILVELFSIKEKAVIDQWLLSMSKPDFHGSFELELIHYFDNHWTRKVFKELNLNSLRVRAKELNMHYIGRIDDEPKKAYLLANPEKNFVTYDSYSVSHFCEKFLEIPLSTKDLSLGFEKDGLYHMPILYNHSKYLGAYELLLQLYSGLDNSGLLKDALFKDSTLTFQLKPKSLEKVNYLKMETPNKSIGLKQALKALLNLLNDKQIKIDNFPCETSENQNIPYLSMKEIPATFRISVKNKKLAKELEGNALFSDAKSILKNKIYARSDGKSYQIDSSYQWAEEINACFSYCTDGDYEFDSFSSPTVVRTLLERIKAGDTLSELHEFHMIASIIAQSNGYMFRLKKDRLKQVLSEQFIKVFGAKTVVSSSKEGDKKARYNHYTVIEVEPVLQRYFQLLQTNISDNVAGMDETDYDVIARPSVNQIDEVLNSVYKDSLSASLTLYHALVRLYESTMYMENYTEMLQLQVLLPHGHSSNPIMPFDPKHPLNKSNYKKIIKEYCFRIFEHTHIVQSFDKPNIRGLNSHNQIFVLKPFSLGTFIHEYVHMATDLLDINEQFEKALSFMNVLAFRYIEPTESDVKGFLNDYKKWLGVL